jgi:hypothetical protein
MADQLEHQTHDGSSFPTAGVPPERARSLGSSVQFRATLKRARQTIRESQDRALHSRSALARAQALVGASERLRDQALALRAQLQASVTAYARDLRADGVPCEQVLVLVKTTVRESTGPELHPAEASELMEDLVRWSIEAYYEAA